MRWADTGEAEDLRASQFVPQSEKEALGEKEIIGGGSGSVTDSVRHFIVRQDIHRYEGAQVHCLKFQDGLPAIPPQFSLENCMLPSQNTNHEYTGWFLVLVFGGIKLLEYLCDHYAWWERTALAVFVFPLCGKAGPGYCNSAAGVSGAAKLKLPTDPAPSTLGEAGMEELVPGQVIGGCDRGDLGW